MAKPQSQLVMLEDLEPNRRRAGNPDRAAHLQFLKRRRAECGPAKLSDGIDDFGVCELSIPEQDFYVLVAAMPDLRSPDPQTRAKAWKAYARSEVARRLGHVVDDSIGRRKPNRGIIIK